MKLDESQNIEFKEIWKDDYLKWICAFANTDGGILYLGVNDNGKIIHLKNYAKLMEDLPNKMRNHLGIICDINLLNEIESYYIKITVNPYDVAISYQSRYYYRSGSTKQELKDASLNEFLLEKSGKTWDDIIEPTATIEDIDNNAIKAFIKGAKNSKRIPNIENNINHIFENLRIVKNGQLKRSAVVLFAKDPRNYYINAYIKIGRFGKSDSDLKFQEIIEGNAFQLADKTIEMLENKFFTSPISYEGLHRIEGSEYPFGAVREALLNAIVHRNYTGAVIQVSVYDDKLTIWNEGKLPVGMKIEDLKKKHFSRPHNPVIADAFFKGGLIETWGRGTIKIMEECKAKGLPEPEIKLSSGGISVTIFKNIYNEEHLKNIGLNDRQLKAVLYVKEKIIISNSDYQKLCSISERTASRDLKELVGLDVFIKEGERKNTKYKLKMADK